MIPGVSSRKRSIFAWVLFALGTLVFLVGSLTVWVKRQALDTDAWVATSANLLEDDEVRQALSVYIVDQLYANADPQEVLREQLPENLQGLAGPIAGALRQPAVEGDRKSTRLNSSHQIISYAVFCLKKKKKISSTTSIKTQTIIPMTIYT